MRKVAALALAGAAAGLAFWRSRSGADATRVDLYFEDGSMVSLPPGTGEADRLLELAGDVLDAAGA